MVNKKVFSDEDIANKWEHSITGTEENKKSVTYFILPVFEKFLPTFVRQS